MQCPSCAGDDIRAGELLELYYDLDDDDEPDELTNGEDILGTPTNTYLVCMDCYHRWEVDGSRFDPASRLPSFP